MKCPKGCGELTDGEVWIGASSKLWMLLVVGWGHKVLCFRRTGGDEVQEVLESEPVISCKSRPKAARCDHCKTLVILSEDVR